MSSNPPKGPAILHTDKHTQVSFSLIQSTYTAAGEGCTHKYEVSEAKLHGAKHAQDDGHNVQEVGQDGSPLVA